MCSRLAPVGPNAWSTLGALLSSSGSRSDVFWLDACLSKSMVGAGNIAFVERRLLGCALARRLSVQMHVRCRKHCFRQAEAFGRHTGQAEVREHEALEIFVSSSGVLEVAKTIVFVVPESRWRSNYYFLSSGNLVTAVGGPPTPTLSVRV